MKTTLREPCKAWPFATLCVLAVALLGAGSLVPAGRAMAEDGALGGTPLLTQQTADGELVGWVSCSEIPTAKTRDVWTLVEGTLTCRGTPKGYLYTKKKYKNFVLRLDWRWPAARKAGNGGVLIRMTGVHRIWPRSLEAQINTGDAGDFWGLAGFPLNGPAERTKSLEHPQFGKLLHLRKMQAAEKPAGQWNSYLIEANEGKVTLTINGIKVNQALRCDAVAGPICLTAEGDEIQFRNVTLDAR